jgi:hypothetical protein
MSWMRTQFNPKRHKLYTPVNAEKYKGGVPIVMRSGLEMKFAQWCDKTTSIIWWSSENLAIPYVHPIKKDKKGNPKKVHYYPDFALKVNTQDGEKIFIIEIKHEKEATKPKYGNRKTLLNEQMTYMVNMAKWNACMKYCAKYGYEFKVVTNKTIEKLR